MNILLVYPECPNTFWSYKYILDFVGKKATFPPLGLLTVAAMLPKNWPKKLVDMNVEELKDEEIIWADMVFVSAMIIQKKSAQEVINRTKAKAKVVVVGGPAFSSQPEKFNGVDHFVLNEAEVTLPLFLEDLAQGRPKSMYTSPLKPDLAGTPIPDWSLINFKHYVSLSVQYSRGCPFNCEFCDIVIMNGRVQRAKAPEQMMREIESLYQAGWRGSLLVVDDNFIGHIANVKKMLAVLIKWQRAHGYPFKIMTEASTNLADDEELMRLMSEANSHRVFLGIETPHKESLKECGKWQNVSRDLVAAVKKIQQHGLQVMGGFIVGFDSDPSDIFDAQIRFIQEAGVVAAMVGMLMILPQTRLWHRLKDEGRLLREATGDNTDGLLNFQPKMGAEALVEGYKKILAAIYSPEFYYQRIYVFLRNYRPKAKSKIFASDIFAFLKSLWRIGILSKNRKYFWPLIIKTCFTKINVLPAAVELAITGLHFEKVSQNVINNEY
jgi:radical SAM superfamily enzyme YgiQ (UPF0313 family)